MQTATFLALVFLQGACAHPANGSEAQTHTLSDLKTISCAGNECDITAYVDSAGSAETVPLRLTVVSGAIVRWWLAVDGNFTNNGTYPDVIVGSFPAPTVSARDAGAYWEVTQLPAPTPNVVVRLTKSPLLLTVLVNGEPVLQEAAPLSYNTTSSWQTLERE